MAKGQYLLELCPFIGFQILPFLKIFVTYFSGTMKARKLKVCINMNNDWMYCVYQNRDQGSITLGVMSLCRFSITYGCDPTSMKLIPHLVSKVRKMQWQNGGKGSRGNSWSYVPS